MPTPTYKALATTTISTTTSTVTFGSIPETYRDLIVVAEGRYSSLTGNILMRFNGDTGTNYRNTYILGTGVGQAQGSFDGAFAYGGGWNSTTRSICIWQIMDASATNKHKTVFNRTDTIGDATYAWTIRWANTARITSITVVGNSNFLTGTTISLYGVVA